MIYLIIIILMILVIAGIFALSQGEGDKYYKGNERQSSGDNFPNLML